MNKVIILGAGNVANHLYRSFSLVEDIEIVQVYNRNPEHLNFVKDPSKRISQLDELKEADLYLVAINDDALTEIADKLKINKGIVAHTSGGQTMGVFDKFKDHGVFYPLQTFSKNKNLNFKEIPICIEANTEENENYLKKIAGLVSEQIYEVNSDQRKALHISAVFVNNFSNHLFTIAEDYCREKELPFKIFRPLIKETFSKIDMLSPFSAQTGPAIRNDQRTIKEHLEMLQGDRKRIYTILTESIQNLHGKKL